MEKNPPKILSKKIVAQTTAMQVEAADLQFSNGVEQTFEFVTIRSEYAVMTIPMLDANTILLIKEYCVGVDRYELTFPKGVLEPGEEVCAAANRELMEEVGYGAQKLTMLKMLTAVPGYLKSKMYCVLAEDLYEKKLEGDEPEPLEVIPWPLDKIDELLQRDDFTEGRSVAAILLLLQHLKKRI